MNKNRILLILYYYEPYVSGVSVYARHIAEGLQRDGYKVTVLTSRFDPQLPKSEVINDVKIVRRPVLFKIGKGVVMPLFWLDILRLARKNDYVNPHLPLAESGLASLLIPRRKIVTTYQCDINLGSGVINKIMTRLSLLLMKIQLWRSRAIVVLNNDYIQHSKMKKFSHKAVPIFAPIDVNEFKPTNSTQFFKKIGAGNSTIKIGFLGRIVYEKGIEYLLACVPELEKQFSEFKIIIGGDYKNVAGGSVKLKLDSFIKKYPDKIVFTGFLTEKEKVQFYSGLDVFVLPSIDPLEAFGMVQVEAMLCGIPVVASDMPGVRVPIKITGYGKIAKPRNSQELTKKIVSVLKNRDKYLPERARVLDIFDPEKTLRNYSDLMPRD